MRSCTFIGREDESIPEDEKSFLDGSVCSALIDTEMEK